MVKDWPSYLDCPRDPLKMKTMTLREKQMERFEGNGAECVALFIKNGCRGRVSGLGIMFDARGWISACGDSGWTISWLAEPCIYTPPDPVWHECTARAATLGYVFDGRCVEFKLTEDAPIEGSRTWIPIPPGYTAWADPYRTYRMQAE